MRVFEKPTFRREFEDWEFAFLRFVGKSDDYIMTLQTGVRQITDEFFKSNDATTFRAGWEACHWYCVDHEENFESTHR